MLLFLSCAAALAEPPQFAAVNITDVLANVRGGAGRGTRVLDKADFTATWLDDGFSAFLDTQITSAADITGLAGAAQAVSNIEAPAGLRLANAWVARDFGGKVGLKLGVIDLNTEFDVQSTAALFL